MTRNQIHELDLKLTKISSDLTNFIDKVTSWQVSQDDATQARCEKIELMLKFEKKNIEEINKKIKFQNKLFFILITKILGIAGASGYVIFNA